VINVELSLPAVAEERIIVFPPACRDFGILEDIFAVEAETGFDS